LGFSGRGVDHLTETDHRLRAEQADHVEETQRVLARAKRVFLNFCHIRLYNGHPARFPFVPKRAGSPFYFGRTTATALGLPAKYVFAMRLMSSPVTARYLSSIVR